MKLPEQRVVPTLRITDYERSKAYYVETPGFTVDGEHRFGPGFPVSMSVARDGMQVYLTQHNGDCQAGRPVHFVIPDVDAPSSFPGRRAVRSLQGSWSARGPRA